MSQTIEAVYEGGSFRPLEPVHLPDGQPVALSVETLAMTRAEAAAYLQGWRAIYEGLSDDEIGELETMILDRAHFMRPTDEHEE